MNSKMKLWIKHLYLCFGRYRIKELSVMWSGLIGAECMRFSDFVNNHVTNVQSFVNQTHERKLNEQKRSVPASSSET